MKNNKKVFNKALLCFALIISMLSFSFGIAKAYYRETLLTGWTEIYYSDVHVQTTEDYTYKEFNYLNGFTFVTNKSENLSPWWNLSVIYKYRYTRVYSFY